LGIWLLDMKISIFIYRASIYWVKVSRLIECGKGCRWRLFQKFRIIKIRWSLKGIVDYEEIFYLAQLKGWLWLKYKIWVTSFSFLDCNFLPLKCLQSLIFRVFSSRGLVGVRGGRVGECLVWVSINIIYHCMSFLFCRFTIVYVLWLWTFVHLFVVLSLLLCITLRGLVAYC